MPKRIKMSCNICFVEQTELKCRDCTFECCIDCIYEWSERSHNCPQCGKFETYNIEYSVLASEEESIYDYDLYDPQFAELFDEDEYEENEAQNLPEQLEPIDEFEDEEYYDSNYHFTPIPPSPPSSPPSSPPPS